MSKIQNLIDSIEYGDITRIQIIDRLEDIKNDIDELKELNGLNET